MKSLSLRLALTLAAFVPSLSLLTGRAAAQGVPAIGGGGAAEDDGSATVAVQVVVDMSDAGKKLVRPTPDHPAYYLPLPAGYKEIGYSPYFQRTPPPTAEVMQLLDRELSRQGYVVMSHEHHPSLVLTFFWGYIDPSGGVLIPDEWMREMTQGDPFPTDWNKSAPNLKMEDPRNIVKNQLYRRGLWYVLISALDFDAWLHHRVVRLWRAHIVTPLWGHYMDQVLPALISTAGPMLGRETSQPQYVTAPVEPMPRVILGTPEVKNLPGASGDKAP